MIKIAPYCGYSLHAKLKLLSAIPIYKISVTGNICSGKSFVSRKISRQLGVQNVDLDLLVASIYNHKRADKLLELHFGTSQKNEIAERIFNEPRKLKILESVLYRLLVDDLIKIIQKSFCVGYKSIVVDIALLYEKGWYSFFDFIILVHTSERFRAERYLKRGSKIDVGQILKNQLDYKKLLLLCNMSYYNFGSGKIFL